MSDLALIWKDEAWSADLVLDAGDLTTDDGLKTAVIVSLFTDRRARPDDRLPEEGADPRGWWGDALAREADDQIGSRLWLLAREKRRPEVLARAREYTDEALAWLIRDGVAQAVTVTAEFTTEGWLALGIEIDRPGGPSRLRFDHVWKALQ